MKKYIVDMQELWIQKVSIEAEDERDAIDRVINGEGDYIKNCLEYVDCNPLDNEDDWAVEEAQEE